MTYGNVMRVEYNIIHYRSVHMGGGCVLKPAHYGPDREYVGGQKASHLAAVNARPVSNHLLGDMLPEI